jgi:thiamine pyrophosphokinase
MKRAILFANGRLDELPNFVKDSLQSNFIIAVDGGTHHCISLGINPDVIIGDFDSLEPNTVSNYQRAGVEIIKYPVHKDETDLELALQIALDRGFYKLFILAALGDRWDMSISNILLLAKPVFSKLDIRLLDGSKELFIIRGGDQVEIHSKSGFSLSLIPLAGDVSGITTSGLEYPLQAETLYFGTSRGISNIFIQDHAQIHVTEGLLLCIYDRAGKLI